MLRDLPSVTPKYTDEEIDKAIKALEQPTHGSTYGGVSWGGTYKEEAQPTDAILREIMARIEHLHDAEDIKGHIREFIKENE